MNSGNDISEEHPLVQEVNRLMWEIQHLIADANQACAQLLELERISAYSTQQIALLMENQLDPIFRELSSRHVALQELILRLEQLTTNSTS
ncbi:uncharacterized protein G6M90_00g084750 [Metarhizium brunneum]|uniref:Uncharacterized protein n=1 Tax=Metarhizium brunneum TaxID=500148 RepID=A0A7D5V130_9HYPO|nr:hypothetical protein G6M90_00g084750 [Metarhizium brunneum]